MIDMVYLLLKLEQEVGVQHNCKFEYNEDTMDDAMAGSIFNSFNASITLKVQFFRPSLTVPTSKGYHRFPQNNDTC